MGNIVTISQLEVAINRSRRMQPVSSGLLTPDLRVMAELYGRMIYDRDRSVDLEQQPTHVREVLCRWLDAGESDIPLPAKQGHEAPETRSENLSASGPSVCAYRAGEPGFDGCETCQ